jgi:lambda repressor-like predicted transcriptional regulator
VVVRLVMDRDTYMGHKGDLPMSLRCETRTEIRLEHDLLIVGRMRRRGSSVEEISETLGINIDVVRDLIRRLKARYRRLIRKDLEVSAGEMLERYRDIAGEAYEAWENSKSERRVINGQCKILKRAGNGDFLKIILECMEGERELKGLDQPKKVDVRAAVLDWNSLARESNIIDGVPDEVEAEINKISNKGSRDN